MIINNDNDKKVKCFLKAFYCFTLVECNPGQIQRHFVIGPCFFLFIFIAIYYALVVLTNALFFS